MTYILAIDTTLGACSTALLKDKEVLSQMMEVRARGHVERLLPMISETLKEAKVKQNDLDFIAVTIGPGTFAGVRIGLSTAKGMALALNIPLIAITSLEAIACQYVQSNVQFSGEFIVAIDARRGEIYMQSFLAENGGFSNISEAEAVPITSVELDVDLIIGSGAVLLQESKFSIDDTYQYPEAAIFGLLALERKGAAKMCDDVSPLYLRAPDAIIPKKLKMIVTDD